tara:strand:+ start:1217 stop:1765 length:549 start_codon:yes stop_codon:yes gene_type:complete
MKTITGQPQSGILVIDVQGNLARRVIDSVGVIQTISKTIRAARLLDIPVIVVEQLPEKLGPTVPELQQDIIGLPVFQKASFDATMNSEIKSALTTSGITHWAVCGIEAHVCVWQTVKGLLDMGFNVDILTDGISSRTATNLTLATSRMKSSGATLSGFEMFMFEQLKDATHPMFTSILPLFK